MVKTDLVQLTRSPAEISALNALRSLPDLLLYSQRPQSAKLSRNLVTSSVTALRSLCSSRGRRQSLTDTSSQNELTSLERWLTLAEISAKLDGDVQSLEREIQVHERRNNALRGKKVDDSELTRLPPAEECELGPKLQCLQEVLGSLRFQTYCRDLFILVRNLRLLLGLYGNHLQDFEKQLCRERRMTPDKLLLLLNENQQEINTPMAEEIVPIELEDFALLFQHCSDPEGFIITDDFMNLLRSLPLDRTTVVRYVFEQLTDTRRGEGYKPPPDYTRIHHIYAVLRLQRSHCSTEEIEAIESWLELMDTKAITLQNLLEFHLVVSDENVTEDAEFVRFLQRMWGFNPMAVKDNERGETIQQVLENYTSRCHLIELITRKREIVAKIPGAQARIRSVSILLESELQHLRVLQTPIEFSKWIQSNESINIRLGKTLVLLRELILTRQVISAIPTFVLSLQELQVLDLRENRIQTISTAFGTMKLLRRLDLSENLLSDASFTQAEDLWGQLGSLTELRLNGNNLTSLPAAVVAIPNLEILELSRNSLRLIRGEVVERWKGRSRLVTLDLHANSLASLPDEMNVLFGTLRCLLLHQNHLTSVPSAAVSELLRLEKLTLSENQLSEESLAFYPVSDVHLAISLAQNRLKVLPRLVSVHAEGKGPPTTLNYSLTSFDVRGNRLRSVVDLSPMVLTCCQALHLQNNVLRELPEGFFTAFPALRVCELQNNQLRLLPVGITECTQLQILHVQDNCLQSLPTELVQLSSLEVLNAAENELTEIPLEWHKFETQRDGVRVIHSLLLRRNPLRNKILKAIVDGADASQFATSDDSACENIIKKLLDSLRDASIIIRNANTTRVSTHKAWIDNEEEGSEQSSKIKWRGVARHVNYYLETRLRATPNSSASLIVDAKSFERLIRSLPFTCSKRELTHLVKRFLIEEEDQVVAGRKRQINGLAFLQAVEQFGRWRCISVPPKRPMSSVAKPTIDSAGPIIQYLVVLQRRIQQELEEKQERREENSRAQQTPSSSKSQKKLRKEELRTPKVETKKDTKRNPKSITTMKLEKTHRNQTDVVANRQRQRIQVLEQQLIDQKLLLLAHQKPSRGESINAIVPADLKIVSDEDHESRTTEAKDYGINDRVVTISVKCLQVQGSEAQQAMKGPARLDLRLRVDDSVKHLKQQLEDLTGVPIDHQILVANSGNRGAPAIRLRNSARLLEYSDHVGSASRWSLTMLIGQSLPLFNGGDPAV